MAPKSKKESAFAELIPAAALKSAPWKNGKGLTKQIAIFPPVATLENGDFLWRLSTSEVNAPGEFSLFPDFDRLLTLTRGEELVLGFQRIHKSLKPGMVLHFQGEEKVESAVPKGPVADVGLIYDRDQVLAKMSLIDIDRRPRSFALTAPTVLFYCLSGELQAMVYPGEKEFELGTGDTLRVGTHADERVVFLDPGKGLAKLAAVEIALVRARSQS